MADLEQKIIEARTEYAKAQKSMVKNCVGIIVDFLNDNNINTIDFTEINNSNYKAFYWSTQFRSLDNNHFVTDRVISLKKEKGVIKVYTEGNVFFFREDIMRDDNIDTIYWSVQVNAIHSVVYLLEYISTYYKVERKAVFVPNGE